MGYIVDFMMVMQSLFFLMQARAETSGFRTPVSKRLFKVALDAYKQDTNHSLQKVHNEIRSFITMKKAIFNSEIVIKEVERLINDHRFKPLERFMAQARATLWTSCDIVFRLFVLYSSTSWKQSGMVLNVFYEEGRVWSTGHYKLVLCFTISLLFPIVATAFHSSSGWHCIITPGMKCPDSLNYWPPWQMLQFSANLFTKCDENLGIPTCE